MIVNLEHNLAIIGEDYQRLQQAEELIVDRVKTVVPLVECLMPSTIAVAHLKTMDYYDNFHGHITEAVPCCNTDEKLVLIPAACLPVYPQFPKLQLKPDIVLSFNSSVFRYEEGKFASDRQWEFIVREFVFVGSEDFVHSSLQIAKNAISACFLELGVSTSLNYASDYFTGNGQQLDVLRRIQIANHLKEEFVFQSNSTNFAIGSVNYHLDHFSRKFGWDDGGRVVSGCIGVGLNRLMSAISLVQDGIN